MITNDRIKKHTQWSVRVDQFKNKTIEAEVELDNGKKYCVRSCELSWLEIEAARFNIVEYYIKKMQDQIIFANKKYCEDRGSV